MANSVHIPNPTDPREIDRTLDRLLPRVLAVVDDARSADALRARLSRRFPQLIRSLYRLYGNRYDFFYHIEQILVTTARMWNRRRPELRDEDVRAESNPTWYEDRNQLGAVCYVDRYAGTFRAFQDRIPYLQEMGITYLHLMPLFRSREGENDGGYAVSDYRSTDPSLGTMDELTELIDRLRRLGIHVVLDFVFNHTADDHDWAIRARRGDSDAREFYLIYPDRTLPDAYGAHLREIFPEARRGSFTYNREMDAWVWTTFHSYQWDLNYGNPAVFRAMAEEMLFLANRGVRVLRLDAPAFAWKELGTSCENRPGAHELIRAFNAIVAIGAPALVLKSEAIVHPDEVAKYISSDECRLSYNPLLMALLWESLATRKATLLRHSMQKRFRVPPATAWVNYVRCHDDIGWTFSDEDAAELGIDGFDHRRFLNTFYTGRFPGSFARGVPFQKNPSTGDARVSGALASLAGLEKAIAEEGETEREMAERRIILLHAVVLSIGGIPLIYLGDELATLNDYSYREEPATAGDSRWVHRPQFDRTRFEQRHDRTHPAGRIYHALSRLFALRRQLEAFCGSEAHFADPENEHLFAVVRPHPSRPVLVVVNFADTDQQLAPAPSVLVGRSGPFHDVIADAEVADAPNRTVPRCGALWITVCPPPEA